jgi:hypothetical protein
MKNSTRPDYRKAKVAALQQLAAAGDNAALKELQRRGETITTAIDVTMLEYLQLRDLVLRWRDGVTPDERRRNREVAERAQHELLARYRADAKLWDGQGKEPQPPPAAPWEAPKTPRSQGWERPAGSKLYPPEYESGRRAAWSR